MNRSEPHLDESVGREIEPEVRQDIGSESKRSESESGTDEPETTERRRFDCTSCSEGTKLVTLDGEWDRGHEVDIWTGCSECGRQTRHRPAGGRQYAYYQWRNALVRQQASEGGDGS